MCGIHLAAYSNLADIMSYLLKAGLFGADVNDQFGRTSLMKAANHGNEAVVKSLLHRQDVEVNAVRSRAEEGYPATALALAACGGHAGTVALLLQ